MKKKVFAYYYPGWIKNREFDEWSLLSSNEKAFSSHNQPKIPFNYYYLENELVLSEQIEMALSHGIDGFIFCWYWDEGNLLMNTALDNLLKVLGNYKRFKFGIMWANRKPHNKLPISIKDINGDFYEAFAERNITSSYTDLDNMLEFCEKNYFNHPNYLKINKEPFFSIFSIRDFLKQFNINELIANRIIEKKFKNIYLVGICHGMEYWLEDAKNIGFKALSSYVLLPDWHGSWLQEYSEFSKKAENLWQKIENQSDLVYHPSVATGWDATPRGKEKSNPEFKAFPWSPIVINNTPKLFSDHLMNAKNFVNSKKEERYIMIASWNEWSEGHYLEPDVKYGYAFLDSVKKIFQLQLVD